MALIFFIVDGASNLSTGTSAPTHPSWCLACCKTRETQNESIVAPSTFGATQLATGTQILLCKAGRLNMPFYSKRKIHFLFAVLQRSKTGADGVKEN